MASTQGTRSRAKPRGRCRAPGQRNRDCSGLIERDVVSRESVTHFGRHFLALLRLHKCAEQHLGQLGSAAPEMHGQRIARTLELG